MKNRGLGKGLTALLNDRTPNINDENNNLYVHIDLLEPGKYQPRRIFDENSLQDLASSIRKNGIIQPILVAKNISGKNYSIIAGERRWRAAKIASISQVPIIVKEISDSKMLEYAIIENIQRQDLTPIEEAESYIRLSSDFDYSQEEVAKLVGKSRSHVANLIRLTGLNQIIKDYLNSNQITMGHARALIGLDDNEALEITESIIAKGLNVRQTENLIKARKKSSNSVEIKTISTTYINGPVNQSNNEEIRVIEKSISETLGMSVNIINDDSNNGVVTIKFNNLSQLDLILQKLNQ